MFYLNNEIFKHFDGVGLATSGVADDLSNLEMAKALGHVLDALIVSYDSKAGVVRLRSSNGEDWRFKQPANQLRPRTAEAMGEGKIRSG